MGLKDIFRAWKDSSYRESLSEEELAQLPANPAGESELSEADLKEIAGGMRNSVHYCGGGGYRESINSCDGTTFVTCG